MKFIASVIKRMYLFLFGGYLLIMLVLLGLVSSQYGMSAFLVFLFIFVNVAVLTYHMRLILTRLTGVELTIYMIYQYSNYRKIIEGIKN